VFRLTVPEFSKADFGAKRTYMPYMKEPFFRRAKFSCEFKIDKFRRAYRRTFSARFKDLFFQINAETAP
jgi:hypothetical protein